MKQLRNLSARPELVVASPPPSTVHDVVTPADIGMPGPLGRGRIVDALPLNKTRGPVQLVAARVMHDSTRCYLGDPDGNLVGDRAALWVHRLLDANVTPDTRRL